MYGRAAFVHYSRWWLRVGRWLLLVTLLAGVGYAHWQIAATAIENRNDEIDTLEFRTLKLAVETQPDLHPDLTQGVSKPLQDWFPRRTDGVINPLLPWVIAWQVTDRHYLGSESFMTQDDQKVTMAGRILLSALALAFLVVLAIACARVLSIPSALFVTMLCGWGVLFPSALRLQPDTLFGILFLITWVGCLMAMPRNSLWAYAIVGVSSGLAYMANESSQLLVVVFIAVTTIRWLWGWVAAHWPGQGGTTLWVRRNHFMGLFLLIGLHLLTIGPRLNHAYEQFGDPFYSVKRQVMWLDTKEQAEAWSALHEGGAVAEQPQPSRELYAASHSQEQMWTRLQNGFATQWQSFLKPPNLQDVAVAKFRGIWLLALFAVLASLAMILFSLRRERDNAGQRLHPESATMALFVIAATLAYALAGAWGTPLGDGSGFAEALAMPLTLSGVWASESLLRRARRRHASWRVFIAYEGILWILIAAMAWQVIEVLQGSSFGP